MITVYDVSNESEESFLYIKLKDSELSALNGALNRLCVRSLSRLTTLSSTDKQTLRSFYHMLSQDHIVIHMDNEIERRYNTVIDINTQESYRIAERDVEGEINYEP